MIEVQEKHFLTLWGLNRVTDASPNHSTLGVFQLLWHFPQPGFKFELKVAFTSLLETLEWSLNSIGSCLTAVTSLQFHNHSQSQLTVAFGPSSQLWVREGAEVHFEL